MITTFTCHGIYIVLHVSTKITMLFSLYISRKQYYHGTMPKNVINLFE